MCYNYFRVGVFWGDNVKNKVYSFFSSINRNQLILFGSILGFLLVLIIGVICFVAVRHAEEKKPIDSDWGEMYYQYLVDFREEKTFSAMNKKTDSFEIHFYDVETFEKPVMVMSYKKSGNNYVNVLFINKRKKVDGSYYSEASSVDFLYNIAEQKYHYYLVEHHNDSDSYKLLSLELHSLETANPHEVSSLIINKNDRKSAVSTEGREVYVTKYHETFVNPEVSEVSFKFAYKDSNYVLRKKVIDAVKKFRKLDITLNNSVKNKVDREVLNVTQKLQAISDIQNGIEPQPIIDDPKPVDKPTNPTDKPSKSSDAGGGINVGDYFIHYGTYYCDIFEESVTINNDGTCIISGKAGTYSIGTHDFSQDEDSHLVKTCLILKNSQQTLYLYPYEDDTLTDGDLGDYYLQ